MLEDKEKSKIGWFIPAFRMVLIFGILVGLAFLAYTAFNPIPTEIMGQR